MNQVVDRVNNRKTCTYVCFEQIFHTTLAGNHFQFAIVFVSGRSGNLVGCYHRDIVLQEIFVKRCDIGAGRTVYKDGIKDVHSDNLVADGLQTTVFTLFQQFLTEIRKVETFTAEHCFGSINDTYHMEFQSVFHHEFLLLATNLFYEAAAYRTDTADKEVQYLIFGEEERVVNDIQGFTQRFGIDHKRDVCFRSSLCTGNYVDTVASQRTEKFTGDTRGMFHILAYDSNSS